MILLNVCGSVMHQKPTYNFKVPNNITSLDQLSNTHGWTTYEPFEVPYTSCSLYNKAGVTDFMHNPQTDFFVGAGKDSITIIVGESWTHGEKIRDSHCDFYEPPESFEKALSQTLGARIAKHLDTDLHQSAWPGNFNAYYFKRLGELVEMYKHQYKKVYIVACITAHCREDPQGSMKSITPDMLSYDFWYNDNHNGKTPQQYLSDYESIWLDYLEELALDNTSIEVICWKNFTKWYSDLSNRNFINIAEQTACDMFGGFTPTLIGPAALTHGLLHSLSSHAELSQWATELEKMHTIWDDESHSFSHYMTEEDTDTFAKYLTSIL